MQRRKKDFIVKLFQLPKVIALQDAVAAAIKRRKAQNLASTLDVRSLINLAALSAHHGLCSDQLAGVIQDQLKQFPGDDGAVDHLTYRDLRKLILLLEHDIVPAETRPAMVDLCRELVNYTCL